MCAGMSSRPSRSCTKSGSPSGTSRAAKTSGADLPVFPGDAGLIGPSQAGKDLMACQPNIRFIIRPKSEESTDHGESAPDLWRHRSSETKALPRGSLGRSRVKRGVAGGRRRVP